MPDHLYIAFLTNKPNLSFSRVAITGNFSDLTNQPVCTCPAFSCPSCNCLTFDCGGGGGDNR